MMYFKSLIGLAAIAAALFLVAGLVSDGAAAVIPGDLGDGVARHKFSADGTEDLGLSTTFVSNARLRSGRFSDEGGIQNHTPLLVFAVPTLGAGEFVDSASLTFWTDDIQHQGGTLNYDVDLYGLGARATVALEADDYYFGTVPDPTDATMLQASILTPASSGDTQYASADIASYMNAQIGAGDFMFLRFSPHTEDVGTQFLTNGYFVVSANGGEGLTPFITYTTAQIPEPSTCVMLTGLLALVGFRGVALRRRRRA